MARYFYVTAFLSLVAAASFCAEPIDGRSASRWKAEPGWTPGRGASEFSVAADGDWLAFSVAGEGKQMTWTFSPSPAELAGEPRYLVLRYRATDLSNAPGDYLLVVQDGSPNWVHYLHRDRLIVDGGEHALVVDVLSYNPPAPINRFALRIGPPVDGEGRLLARIDFTDHPPRGVQPVGFQWPAEEKIRFRFSELEWTPSPHWTPRPPEEYSMEPSRAGMRYIMRGQRKSMRWSSRFPREIDTGKMPFVSLRYRAAGDFGPYGYVFYLRVMEGDGETQSAYAMQPGDVNSDGRWHVHHAKLGVPGTAGSSVAVGIDSLSPEAEIELDYIEFSSVPPKSPVEEMFTFEKRPGPWPAGRDGFTTIPLPKAHTLNHFMLPRMGIGSWFDAPEITVEGIPFRVAEVPEAMPCTGTVDEESIEVALPEGTREVLFVLATCFPRGEKFGSNWRADTPLRALDEPERVTVELSYSDGTSEEMLPIRASNLEYGIGHDIALHAVRPSPGKTPVKLILHDRMRNACFGILGVTANRGTPRVKEPELHHLWYPEVKKPPMAGAEISFAAQRGITWSGISSPMLGGTAIDLSGEPIFRLKVGEREVTSAQFTIDSVERSEGEMKVSASFAEDTLSFKAVFEVKAEGQNAVRIALKLANAGRQAVTGTLFFPTVSRLHIGTPQDTWYFCARRGGVINRIPCVFRDEIGEGHPLQVDGFFNPKIGAGVCFMPRDLDGVFRWYCVGKDESGGSYALEFLPQTVEPGGVWECVPVVVGVVPGDWRDQLKTYLAWVRTWFKPLVPRKQWFREVFSFPTYCPGPRPGVSLDDRMDFLALVQRRKARVPGSTDYLHLFGWAKTEEYGHWGDYDHYFQLGGKERLTKEVRQCQEAGIPVGLYLDCYLVSTKSQKPPKGDVEKWAVRKENGDMLYHESYIAHSLCPYVRQWRDYLTAVYARVAKDIKPSGMYLDEYGKCLTSRICHSASHGHRAPMGMCSGEWILTKQIRRVVPAEIATYCEYVPADVACQYLDGAFGHVPLYGHRDGYDKIAPHYVNLHRFALPDFKTFQLIYYVPLQNGNWFLLKYPFFNGDGYYLTDAEFERYDEHSRAFLARVFDIQHRHKDAFTSMDVEPLVRTELPGLYANRFSTAKKNLWTLFNANYRAVGGRLLVVQHKEGARYLDVWNQKPLSAEIKGGNAHLMIELGPRTVGCVLQGVE